jgi:hypothetical protein
VYIFEALDARADGRLRQVLLTGGFQKTAMRRDGQEGTGLFNVHACKPARYFGVKYRINRY